ncbi:MAG: glycosyltransferase family 4 protein [Nanoarchaeota archaeon]|nr:glycosyltransferase family 4 protein [Nanoarchaeota archaeon]
MTSYINSVSDGLRTLGHQVDVVTLFGISKYQETKNTLVEKIDKLLLKSPKKTFILYILTKAIIGFWLVFFYPFKKWDIILAQDVSAVNAIRVAKFLFKKPIVLVVHGSMPIALIYQEKIQKGDSVWEFMINEEKRAYQQVKAIIANSTYTAKNYIPFPYNKSQNISIIHNLVNEKIFYPDIAARNNERQKLGISPDKFVIFFAGRLTEVKGVIFLLMAFKNVSQNKEFILVYAGDGPERIKLEQYSQENNLKDKVKILGSIPYIDMGKIYNIADVLVVPSITVGEVQEPLGIVALEGMAIGIPVITFGVGGLKEIIKDGYNGILIPEKDTDKLAQAILEIKKNSALAQKLIQNGKKEIEEKYTTKVVAQKLINIFQKILSK